jgi:hypothetical protein
VLQQIARFCFSQIAKGIFSGVRLGSDQEMPRQYEVELVAYCRFAPYKLLANSCMTRLLVNLLRILNASISLLINLWILMMASLLGALVLCPMVSALAFNAPQATHTVQLDADIGMPQPTEAPNVQELHRRQSSNSLYLIEGPDEVCGYQYGQSSKSSIGPPDCSYIDHHFQVVL